MIVLILLVMVLCLQMVALVLGVVGYIKMNRDLKMVLWLVHFLYQSEQARQYVNSIIPPSNKEVN